MKVATTDQLRTAYTPKVRRLVSHPLLPAILERLHADGAHILTDGGMLHDTGPAGIPTWRGTVFLLTNEADPDHPEVVFADIPLQLYNALPTYEEFLKAREAQ
jgi:hypothetical protein